MSAKSLLATIGAIAAMLVPAAQAATSAPITAVVLYPGSATVTRTAHVDAGATRVVIGDVTAGFALPTLRAEADAGIQIGRIVTKETGRTASPNPAEANLEDKIQAMRDQVAALDAEAAAADIVKGYLERLGGDGAQPGGDRRQAPLDAKTLSGLIDAIGRGAGEALAKKEKVAVQKRELGKKIAALQRELQHLRSGTRDTRSISVELTAERAGFVRVSYQVNNAGWKPSYRAELDSAASTVALERLAEVSQKTGEDWSGVRVSLSTSRPRLSPLAPEPQPWLLSYQPPEEPRVMGGMAADFAAAPAAPAPLMARAKSALAEEPGYVPPTFQSDAAFATEFAVPGSVDLPADGREISLPLARETLAVKLRSQVTPRLDRNATVTAEAERPSGVWLPGEMQIYRDGNYVGAGRWDPQQSDKLALSFGRDDLLHVTLDAVKGKSGSTGVFEKRNRRSIDDLITVTSQHPKPIDVLVIEASPVSTSDEITVQSTFDPKPSIDTWQKRRGVVAWERTLKRNETLRIGVSYTIDYPKEGTVNGLP
jgi:uncharacterized protein (TIGR02231 family)